MKIAISLLFIAGVVSLTSCISFSTGFSPRVALSVYSDNDAMRVITRELQAHASKGAIKSITVHNAEQSTSDQFLHIRSLINAGSADLLLIQSSDKGLVKRVYELVQTSPKVMPIIFLTFDESVFENTLARAGAYEKIGCIVMLGEAAGRVQAQFVRTALRGRGSVGLLVGALGSTAQVHRTRGFEQGLRGSAVTIKHQESAHWRSIAASKVVQKWLQSEKSGLSAIVANDDTMALGAALALKEHGLKVRVLVLGGGVSEDGLAALQAGELDMTLMPNASQVVHALLRMAEKLSRDDLSERDLAVPPLAVHAENLGAFVEQKE